MPGKMTPFMTESVYRNLVCTSLRNAPESVHLSDYPAAVLRGKFVALVTQRLSELMTDGRCINKLERQSSGKILYHDKEIRDVQREINEYGMLRDFVESLPDGDKKYTLQMSITGRGAFRRFKDTVRHFDLEDKWYAFRDKCYARVARRWCEDNDLEYYQKGKGIPLEELLEDIAEDEDEPVDVVKIDMESLSIPGTAEALLKNLFGAEVEHVADEDITEEEAANSLSPGQAIKLMFLHKQMTRLKEGLASLAKDVPASLGEVLTSCSEDVSTALNRLEQEIGEVEILAEDEQIVKLKEIVELLKKHAKGEE